MKIKNCGGFTAVRANCDTRACGKSKDGGLVTVKKVLCCQDLELPRKFSHVITICVYIPPRANAATACERIHSVTATLQRQHPVD